MNGRYRRSLPVDFQPKRLQNRPAAMALASQSVKSRRSQLSPERHQVPFRRASIQPKHSSPTRTSFPPASANARQASTSSQVWAVPSPTSELTSRTDEDPLDTKGQARADIHIALPAASPPRRQTSNGGDGDNRRSSESLSSETLAENPDDPSRIHPATKRYPQRRSSYRAALEYGDQHFPQLLGELPWMFAVGVISEAPVPVPNTAHLIGSDVVDAGTPKGLDSIKNGHVVEYIAVG